MKRLAASRSTLDHAARRHWLWPTRRRLAVGLVAAFALWGWFDVRNRGRVDPDRPWVHKTDLTVYTEAGAAFFDGRDPYQVTNPRGWGYLYPPLFAILVAPLDRLDEQDQVLVWFVLNVLIGWGCLREMARVARGLLAESPPKSMLGPVPIWLAAAAVTAALLPALNCLQRGQVGLVKLYALLLGFRVLMESRGALSAFLGGSILAFPIALKITPLVVVGVVLAGQWTAACCARIRAEWVRAGACTLGITAGLAVCFLLLPAAAVGWRANLDHLDRWWNTVALRAESTTEDDFAGDSTSVRNQSLVNAVHRLGNWAHYYFAGGPHDHGARQLRLGGPGLLMDAPIVDRLLQGVRVLAAGLIVAVGFRMARRRDPLGAAAAFGLACVATLVIFPIARGHYYVLMLPAVTLASLWHLEQGRTRWAVALAVAPGALVLAHYVLLDFTGRIGLLGLGTTAWYATACGAMLWPRGSAAGARAWQGEVTLTPVFADRVAGRGRPARCQQNFTSRAPSDRVGPCGRPAGESRPS